MTRHPSGTDGMEMTLLDSLATSYLDITRGLDHIVQGRNGESRDQFSDLSDSIIQIMLSLIMISRWQTSVPNTWKTYSFPTDYHEITSTVF